MEICLGAIFVLLLTRVLVELFEVKDDGGGLIFPDGYNPFE